MLEPLLPTWVEAVPLPFGQARARLSDDWQACATTLARVLPVSLYEPLPGQGPYRHRQASLDLGVVQALAVVQSDILMRARRCSAGRAFLRLPLSGCAHIRQQGRSYSLVAGSACFDRDDSSSYEARSERSGMLVLSFDPQRLAAAAALIRGPWEDPDPFLARLPEQRLLAPTTPALPLLISQISRSLSLADASGQDRSPGLRPRLAALLERATALMLFPELMHPS